MKKIFSVIILILSATHICYAEPSEWAADEIETAIESGLLPEQNRGDYQNSITRVEVCQLADNLLNKYGYEFMWERPHPFSDTSDESVKNLYYRNIINGKSETEFCPYDYITREELAKVLYNTYVYMGADVSEVMQSGYKDYEDISDWAVNGVDALTSLGIFKGNENNEFLPDKNITKEETVTAINRLAGIAVNIPVGELTQYTYIDCYLDIRVPENRMYNQENGHLTVPNISGDKFEIFTDNKIYRSCGNIEEDAKNLGAKAVGDSFKEGDTVYLETEDGYILKNGDGVVSRIYVSGGDEAEGFADSIAKNIGFRDGVISERTEYITFGYLTYSYIIPEWYTAESIVEGFAVKVESIKKVRSTEQKESSSYINICIGKSGKSFEGERQIKSTMLGNEFEWQISGGNMYAEVYTENGELLLSIEAYAEDSETEKMFIELVEGVKESGGGAAAKPVIYMYPETEQEVSVKLDIDGEFTFTYPEYNDGWNVTAKPDGTIISDGREYSYLFWEGKMPSFDCEIKEGFVVKGSESAEFLREKLEYMGLTPKEYNEFIVYWAPILAENEYNKIYFAGEEYVSCAPLEIYPRPDSVLRIFMVYEPAEEGDILPEQKLYPFERQGFTVVEWGGNKR